MESSPKHSSHENALLERWKRVPIIVVSQSKFRISQLEKIGFTNISTSASIPADVEVETAITLNNTGGIKSYYSSDGHDVTRYVAGAKVQYILDNEDVPHDAVILGFDTAPVVWKYDLETEEDSFLHLEKPQSSEELCEMILSTVMATAVGCSERKKRLEEFAPIASLQDNVEDQEMVMNNYQAFIKPGSISIVSSVAGSFPQNRTVRGFSDEVQLFSRAIDAMRHDQQALELLSEKIFEIMRESGMSISGGIDFSDVYIQDLLKLEELKPEFQEGTTVGLDLYLGFPKKAFITLLASIETKES